MTTTGGAAQNVRWSAAAIAHPAERAAAWLIDSAVFWVVWVAGMILLIETGELGDPPRLIAPRALLWLAVVWVLSRCYDALSIARWGSTAGRRVLEIEVRDQHGALPRLSAAFARSTVRTVGLVAFGVGLWMLWTDPRRRALHDRAAATMVVRCELLEPVAGAQGGMMGDDAPAEPTEAAIRRARSDPATAGWLRAVAAQAETRLDVAAPSWRRGEDREATGQRAFCLLVATLIARHPEQRGVLTRVLDRHAVLDDIAGSRERHLARLLDDHDRVRRWLGLPDSARVHLLVDAPAQPSAAWRPASQPGVRDRR
ncbi:hypothetical protein BH23ACT10_BH23ACT10_28040 [soil metagenome]